MHGCLQLSLHYGYHGIFYLFKWSAMIGQKYYTNIVKLFITLVVIDFDGDFLIRQEEGIFNSIQNLIRIWIVVLLLIIGFAGVFNIGRLTRVRSVGLICLGAILAIFGYGVVYGVLANNPTGAVREFIAVAPLVMILGFVKLERGRLIGIAKYLIYSLILVLGVKILISQVVSISIYGNLSWKVLLRLSPMLLLPYAYILVRIIKGDRKRWDPVLLFVVAVEIFMTQARALNVSLFLVTLIILATGKLSRRSVITIMVVGIAAISAIALTGGAIENVFGIWSGENFSGSADYRVEQFEILIDRYASSPLTGFGFGYFTPGYEAYEELANSYLLELDLMNFTTKVGLPLSVVYAFTYILFLLQYRKTKYPDRTSQVLAFSYLLTLFAILFYSVFQTGHSGMTYWLVYAIAFAFVFIKGTRMQEPRGTRLRNEPGFASQCR